MGIYTEITQTDKETRVDTKLDRIAARKFMDNWKENKNKLSDAGVNQHTINHVQKIFDRSDSSFLSGSFDDLISDLNGSVDMKPFNDQYEKLKNTDIMSKLKTNAALGKPRRKRRMSEHEGDWDFDRMWELKPYQKCERKKQLLKTVKIEAHFSCSGGVDSWEINKYGGLVWAISQIIENAGIQTEVYYCESGIEVGIDKDTRVETKMLIKKPGEYLAPTFLAACFSSNFYRRLGFALQAVSVPVNNNDRSCHTMGRAKPTYTMRFEDGVLQMNVKSFNLNFSEVERTIMQIIGKEDI
jgi:hypothetical protein